MALSYGDVRLDQAVTYDGVNRPELKNLRGKVVNFNYSSALVEFKKNGKVLKTEWVGLRALDLLKENETVKALRDKKEKLQEQIENIDKALTALADIDL